VNRSHILYVSCITFSLGIVGYQEVHAQKKPVPNEKPSLADIIEQVEPSCVRIDVTLPGGKGIGSGFVVGDGTIVVTNHHVAAGANAAVITFADGFSTGAKGFLAFDEKRDIAILKVDTARRLVPLKLIDKLPRKGDSTIAIGAPKGLSFSASEGIVSAIREGKELKEFGAEVEGKWLQTSTPISGGSSGGPLLNLNGEVIGMNTAGIAQAQNVNFAISSGDILEVIEKAKNAKVTALKEIKPSKNRRIAPTPSAQPEVVCKLPAKRKFNHKLKIAEEHDKFDQVKWLRTEWIAVPHKDPRFAAFAMRFSAPMKDPEPPPVVVIDFQTSSKSFEWLRSNELKLLVDGEAIDAGRVSHKGEVKPGFVIETMSVGARLDEFIELIMAQSVEMRLGTVEFSFANHQLECLRDFASRFPEGNTPVGNITAGRHTIDSDPSLPKNRAAKKKADAAKAKADK
jgi:hypothetical protein